MAALPSGRGEWRQGRLEGSLVLILGGGGGGAVHDILIRGAPSWGPS